MQDLRALLELPPFNVPRDALPTVRFYVNSGEIYDFTYVDLIGDGDIIDYATPPDGLALPPLVTPSPRLTEPIPVRVSNFSSFQFVVFDSL